MKALSKLWGTVKIKVITARTKRNGIKYISKLLSEMEMGWGRAEEDEEYVINCSGEEGTKLQISAL